MQEPKRCVHCNTINAADRLYCENCGKFLSSKKQSSADRITVWGRVRENSENKVIATNKTVKKKQLNQPSRKVVVCRECGNKIEVKDGLMPLCCNDCGYFFQDGVDKIISEESITDNVEKPINDSANDSVKPTEPLTRRNPLPTAKKDTSSMRLISISAGKTAVEEVSEYGAVVGLDGTVLKEIKTDQQISFWHGADGWHARAMNGTPLFNGAPMNIGIEIKLSDGDILFLERNQIRVEITCT